MTTQHVPFPHKDGQVKPPRKVKFCFSEPWELASALKDFYYGYLTELYTNKLNQRVAVIAIESNVVYNGVKFSHLIAHARYSANPVSDVLSSFTITAGGYMVAEMPTEVAEYTSKFVPDSNNSLACICDVVPI